MFKVGDKVIHQREGACNITQTIDMEMGNSKKEYFVLSPILDKKSSVYISIDKKKQDSIRHIINRKQLKQSETRLQNSNPAWVSDMKARHRLFMNSISTFQFEELLDIYKCLTVQNEEQALSLKDKDFLFAAEKMIGSEIALLLEQDYEYVLEKMKEYILC